MKITLEFDNLREMQKAIDRLFILFPEDLNPEGGGVRRKRRRPGRSRSASALTVTKSCA